jgi:hypothetical protein
MPNSNNPYAAILNLIEETIWAYDNFTKREFRAFGYRSPGFRKFLEPGKNFLRFLAKIQCRRRLVAVNICKGFKELAAACGSK